MGHGESIIWESVVRSMGHGESIARQDVIRSMGHGESIIWESVVRSMGHGESIARQDVVQSMGHEQSPPPVLYGPWVMENPYLGRCRTASYAPWVMGFCHIVWSMGHGKKIAEGALFTPSMVCCSFISLLFAYIGTSNQLPPLPWPTRTLRTSPWSPT